MCSPSLFFFFFSSRRRHTRLQGDWSSDVCSSDLGDQRRGVRVGMEVERRRAGGDDAGAAAVLRSEERRVGKGGRYGGSPKNLTKRRLREVYDMLGIRTERDRILSCA